MADNHNAASPCTPGCSRIGEPRLFDAPRLDGTDPDNLALGHIRPADPDSSTYIPMGSTTFAAAPYNGSPIPFAVTPDPAVEPFDDGCDTFFPAIGTVELTHWSGPGQPYWSQGGNGRWIFQTPNGGGNKHFHARFHWHFFCPLDFVIQGVSLQATDASHGANRAEYLVVETAPDEIHPLPYLQLNPEPGTALTVREGIEPYTGLAVPPPGSPSHMGANYPGRVWRDQNDGGSLLIYRQVQDLYYSWHGSQTWFSNTNQWVMMAPEGRVPQPCRDQVRPVINVTPTTDARWRGGCLSTTPGAEFILPLTQADPASFAAWEYSSDSGATWGPAPTSAPHTAGDPAGLHRWRITYTIPPGLSGYWYMKNLTNVGPPATQPHGAFFIDGVQMNDGFKFGYPAIAIYTSPITGVTTTRQHDVGEWSSPYQTVVPGTYVMEWREGAWSTDGVTEPEMEPKLAAVVGDRQDIVIIEELSKATGAVVATTYQDLDGNPVTPAAWQQVDEELCTGCDE